VPRTLLDELDADLKWGSSVPAERLASISARIVQALTETVGGPLFRRVVAQGMKVDDVACLTMPEIKGGVIRSHLVGRLAQKRKLAVEGPLSDDTDEKTVKRATKTINLFFSEIQTANVDRWETGRRGALCVNVGVRALLLLFDALIKHAEQTKKAFDPRNVKPEEIIAEVMEICKPMIEFIRKSPDDKFVERFGVKYGSGGPTVYFYELSQIIWNKNNSFKPEGLEEYLHSKDDRRVKEAGETIKFIESRMTDIIVNYFKKMHGSNYWNYIGTKEMRVKAYERQQEEAPEKQLELEAYLDLIDKKKIVEKSDHWSVFKPIFDIPLPGEKGYSKNVKWMDRLNELRRIVAHPAKRAFKSDDLEFLEWIRKEFGERLLSPDAASIMSIG
jgi:DNA sulfur modification protein DndB